VSSLVGGEVGLGLDGWDWIFGWQAKRFASETETRTHNQPTHSPSPNTTHNTQHNRRAKILKKLERLLTSGAAQSSTIRFKRGIWVSMLLLIAIHVAGFAIVTTQIESRYS